MAVNSKGQNKYVSPPSPFQSHTSNSPPPFPKAAKPQVLHVCLYIGAYLPERTRGMEKWGLTELLMFRFKIESLFLYRTWGKHRWKGAIAGGKKKLDLNLHFFSEKKKIFPLSSKKNGKSHYFLCLATEHRVKKRKPLKLLSQSLLVKSGRWSRTVRIEVVLFPWCCFVSSYTMAGQANRCLLKQLCSLRLSSKE